MPFKTGARRYLYCECVFCFIGLFYSNKRGWRRRRLSASYDNERSAETESERERERDAAKRRLSSAKQHYCFYWSETERFKCQNRWTIGASVRSRWTACVRRVRHDGSGMWLHSGAVRWWTLHPKKLLLRAHSKWTAAMRSAARVCINSRPRQSPNQLKPHLRKKQQLQFGLANLKNQPVKMKYVSFIPTEYGPRINSRTHKITNKTKAKVKC